MTRTASSISFHPEHVFPTEEGQLSVDVMENERDVIICAAIAGIKPEEIEIHLSHDMVTIRGKRSHQQEQVSATYHFQECFWGSFSRSVILPSSIRPDEAEAVFKNGILTLTLPKAVSESRVPIRIET
ncbi:MAG: Hsp20/alpha crystallin family protein [Patescibacteria group bacterium]